MAIDFPRIQSVFQAVAELPSGERAAALERQCGDDTELRHRVEALLQAHDDSGELPAAEPLATGEYMPQAVDAACRNPSARTSDFAPVNGPGAVIAGRYALLEKIGEGGMGEVWVAKQTEPIKRKVALKLIKAGMDTKAVLQRFEQERQALALMDHPHIAKVLDGGITADRRPFFVMELVSGLPLTRFCDDAKLGVRERLELFVPICQAVQHAHQKGIIHRDLKPSNILVTIIDGRGVPKVIDFGVAKATSGRLTEESLSTQFGAVIGTLEYMSPEQAGYAGEDIDTRADIYTLGVILYELLTGLKPHDGQRLRKAALTEMVRIIREEEPSKPSTRISTDASAPSLAALRLTEPKKLAALLRGELDWMVMKCLEKQRDRRYETANGLARDIQRYLADEVVEARPPSTGYRLRKFVRRNKGPVVAASGLACALLAGSIGTSWGMIRAEQARGAEAERAEGERQAKDREAAQRQLAEANETKALAAAKAEKQAKEEVEAVLGFVENKVFAAARPKDQEGGLGYDVKLADAIKAALPFVDRSFTTQPLIEARLRMSLGISFSYLGEPSVAAKQFEQARTLYTKHLGPDDRATWTCLQDLALSYGALGQHVKEAELLEKTLAARKAKLGPDHYDTLMGMSNLASSYIALGRHAAALKLLEETLSLQKAKLGPDHRDTLATMANLATCYMSLGRNEDALRLSEETWALQKAKLGADHPDTLKGMSNLAVSYRILNRNSDALKLSEEALVLHRARLGPNHPGTLATMGNLALCYQAAGRHTEALKLHEESLALTTAKLGPDHPDTLKSINNLATYYLALGRDAEALPLFENSLAKFRAKLGPEHPLTLVSMSNLSICYAAVGREAEAIKLREEALAMQITKLGPNHPDTLYSMNGLGRQLATAADVKLHNPQRAVDLAAKAAEGAPRNPFYRATLGIARYRAGDWKGAVADLELIVSITPPDHPANAPNGFFLAMAHWQLGEKDKAREWFDKAVAWMEQGKQKDHRDLKRFRAEAAELLSIRENSEKQP